MDVNQALNNLLSREDDDGDDDGAGAGVIGLGIPSGGGSGVWGVCEGGDRGGV